ncbi:hypothetical protein BaRGS_00022817 [Batillaria attramentaria]|uniref:Uncharacterized protein n=1 Tax=Batillaria attramentaria TaxID=370345 RepID=A0ABD0KFJ6_9CAEN
METNTETKSPLSESEILAVTEPGQSRPVSQCGLSRTPASTAGHGLREQNLYHFVTRKWTAANSRCLRAGTPRGVSRREENRTAQTQHTITRARARSIGLVERETTLAAVEPPSLCLPGFAPGKCRYDSALSLIVCITGEKCISSEIRLGERQ